MGTSSFRTLRADAEDARHHAADEERINGGSMQYAALIEVANSREDPEAGCKGLRDELLPTLMGMPGFVTTLLLTAYERGREVAVLEVSASA
jgi:hypothetical protein